MNEDGTVTFSAVQPRVGVPLTASFTDIDGGVSNVTWQWYNGDIRDDNVIEGATSDTYKPTSDDAANNGVTLQVRATYTDAQGPMKMSEGAATIAVQADTRNKAPKFADDQDPDTSGDQAEAKRTIAEKSAAGTALNGGEVTATDADAVLTYTLSGADASSFEISSAADDMQGRITVGVGTKLDYETKSSYMVTVTATDSFGLSDSVDVIITVTDVNEGPEITLGGLAISGVARVEYAENGTDMVAMYSATGPESANAMWSLEGDDAADFRIGSSSGVLTFRNAPDYENAADADMDNTYMVTVMADDGTYMAMREVVVTVTDVEDTTTVIGGTLLERYDTNPMNGQIDKSEVVDAIIAFVTPGASNKPSKQDIVDLIVHFVTTPR